MLIPVLLGISFILFTILNLTPGDSATLILGNSANPESIEMLRKELGLNGGFFERYFNYIGNIIFHGDFGISYRTRNDVFMEIFTRFNYTVRLAFTAIAISSILGVLLGILSAIRQYSKTNTAHNIRTAIRPFGPGMSQEAVTPVNRRNSGVAISKDVSSVFITTLAKGARTGAIRDNSPRHNTVIQKLTRAFFRFFLNR